VLALALAAFACRGDPPPEEPPARAPLPGLGDPAVVRSISPDGGAPGTEVILRAGGLPRDTEVEIGFGAPNTDFEILGRARTDSLGDVTATLAVPAWAIPGQGYMFVVAPVDQPPRAASDTFRVTPRGVP
jgi:hypothetical protein